MRSHPGRPIDRNATLVILSCYFGGLLNGPFGQEMLHDPKYAPKMAANKACRHAGTIHVKPRQNPIKRQFWRGFVMSDQMVSQQDVQPFKTLFNHIVILFQTTILVGAPDGRFFIWTDTWTDTWTDIANCIQKSKSIIWTDIWADILCVLQNLFKYLSYH